MTTAQKVIKYLATALAIFLVITIVSVIVNLLAVVVRMSDFADGTETSNEETEISNKEIETLISEGSDARILKIETVYTDVVIKKGDYLRAETTNREIRCTQNNQILEIEEDANWFSDEYDEILTVYIPEKFQFDNVIISSGAGTIKIEQLNTKQLEFEVGAGKVEIENLYVEESASIEGGAGKFTILSGIINNLDLDMGVGKTEITARLLQDSDIDAGVGKLEINIIGKKEEYKIEASTGIGSVKVDGEQIKDNEQIGNGINTINLDGGIGSTTVTFVN